MLEFHQASEQRGCGALLLTKQGQKPLQICCNYFDTLASENKPILTKQSEDKSNEWTKVNGYYIF